MSAPLFEQLLFWHDLEPRSGAENMAVDEWLLLEGHGLPVLRIYEWGEPTVSFGYFDEYVQARALFADDGLSFVRRMTGGGVVDHRIDVTYSLIIPRGEAVAEARGEASYAMIHRAVMEVLKEAGVEAELIEEDSLGVSSACFERPVAWDLVDEEGRKLAGAGQRRSRGGLLHQGSVQGLSLAQVASCLPEKLARSVAVWEPAGALERGKALLVEKYERDSWLRRR